MYTGFVNVYEEPWPSKVKNLEVTKAYELAHERTSASLDRVKAEKLRIEQEEAALRQLFDSSQNQKVQTRVQKQQVTALEQKQQMQVVDAVKRDMGVQKLIPGINPQFHGYPSIPETPPDERFQRKLRQQQMLKVELELQVAMKKQADEEQKQQDKKLVETMLAAAEAVGKSRAESDQTKKFQSREEMCRSWKQALEVKSANVRILSPSPSLEANGITQSGGSEYKERFQGYKPILTVSDPITASLPHPNPDTLSKKSSDLNLNGTQGRAQRKKIAERLQAQEDEKAKHSIQKQVETYQEEYAKRTYSTSPSRSVLAKERLINPSLNSPDLRRAKASHLKSVGGLISRPERVEQTGKVGSILSRSISQPRINH